MDPRARLIVVAVLLAVGGTVAIIASRGDAPGDGTFVVRPTPTAPLPAQCLELPDPIAKPSWLPKDLPLPPGTYANAEPPAGAEGIYQIAMTSERSLDDMVKFILDRWPKAGWELGRGEREPGEAEAVFFADDKKRYGQFRARAVYCDQAWTELLLVLVLDEKAA